MDTSPQAILLGDRLVEYRVRRSAAGTRLRVQVGPAGVRVVQPAGREPAEVEAFLAGHEEWVLGQIARLELIRKARRETQTAVGEILFRGAPMSVRVLESDSRRGAAQVAFADGRITIRRGRSSPVPAHVSLENWLRREARAAILAHLEALLPRINRPAGRIYVMAQRTKWGNCSPLGNLSFNWRLILAPDPVLRYLVTHEAVHLAVPDHSPRFWLTVRSLCPDSERSRQWLCANSDQLCVDLRALLAEAAPTAATGPASSPSKTAVLR